MCIMHEENKNIVENSFQKLTTAKAIVVAGALIAGSIIFSRFFFDKNAGLQTVAQKVTEQGSSVTLVNKVNDKKDYIRGAKNPKVTIVEFSDFGCGFCASFHPTLRDIIEKYPKDVAWVYRHLPYRNNNAALASECVGQHLGNEAFWKYSDILFSQFPDISDDFLVSEAIKLGFNDEKTFRECQKSESVSAAVQEDATEARLIGAAGTPHSIIITADGKTFPLRGATPIAQLDQMISILVNNE